MGHILVLVLAVCIVAIAVIAALDVRWHKRHPSESEELGVMHEQMDRFEGR